MADLIAGEVLESTRPWLEARMPAWPSRAQHLAQGLAHGSGLSSVAQTHTPGAEAQKEMGELLVGAKGFSCNACHAVGDEPALSVFEGAGPNLKLVPSRLREGYYFDWMHFPQRWMPDTIMPRYAENNQSPLESYAGGRPTCNMRLFWNTFMTWLIANLLEWPLDWWEPITQHEETGSARSLAWIDHVHSSCARTTGLSFQTERRPFQTPN